MIKKEVREELVSYIEKELRRGFHVDEIKKELFDEGYEAEEVEDAINHTHMLHKHMSIGYVIALIVVAIAVIFVFGALSTVKIISEDAGWEGLGESSLQSVLNRDVELFNQGVDEKNKETCMKIINTELKQDCISRVDEYYLEEDQKNYVLAVNNMKRATCDEIMSDILRAECVSKIDEIQSKGGVSVTDNQRIYIDAVNSLDAELCEEIVDSVLRVECVSKIEEIQSIGEVDSISEDQQLFVSAINEQNEQLCDQISDADLREECLVRIDLF